MISNLKAKARQDLSGRWGFAALITLLFGVVTIGASSLTLGLGTLFLAGPLYYGYNNIFYRFSYSEDSEFSTLFSGFDNFLQAMCIYLLEYLFIMLWTLLFIIPGIIKMLAYSQSMYIAIDHPEYSARECIRASQEMMHGHKLELFVLMLSFIGWILLTILTLGIGMIWLYPYITSTLANFYKGLKENAF